MDKHGLEFTDILSELYINSNPVAFSYCFYFGITKYGLILNDFLLCFLPKNSMFHHINCHMPSEAFKV